MPIANSCESKFLRACVVGLAMRPMVNARVYDVVMRVIVSVREDMSHGRG